ncbi:hypothetical protein J5N97_018874 [Dioscorea zingiberensis]|uniref:Methyltransferase domain-containing protein n=1 Tax=Dioscorea zingiberensis TaxID=325984 RepID=A0A9D5CET3_9LILI|nr:hypothetical protein J5N97_018874 [Dioscorea zingiberensis]
MAGIVDEMQKEVTEFYEESSEIWESMWGDHFHQGFYEPGVEASLSESRSAQIRMIDEALRFAGVSDEPSKRPKRVVDVGCGIGGTSFYIAEKYGAECHGIDMSSVQIQRAETLAISKGLADKFMSELSRVTAPGGIIIVTCVCHRDLKPYEDSLPPEEDNVMNKINTAFYHPECYSPSDFVKLAKSLSLQDIKIADWSDYVTPYYPAVMKTVLTWETLEFLLQSGPQSRRRALGIPYLMEGYNMKVLKYTILACRKPE